MRILKEVICQCPCFGTNCPKRDNILSIRSVAIISYTPDWIKRCLFLENWHISKEGPIGKPPPYICPYSIYIPFLFLVHDQYTLLSYNVCRLQVKQDFTSIKVSSYLYASKMGYPLLPLSVT